eukprot:5388825-Pleurochrysis_carterae.AAC.1
MTKPLWVPSIRSGGCTNGPVDLLVLLLLMLTCEDLRIQSARCQQQQTAGKKEQQKKTKG